MDVVTDRFGLRWAQGRVRAFHEKAAQPHPAVPTQLSTSRARIRADWMREEIDEFLVSEDLTDQVDAIVDLIYFAIGTGVELGVDLESVFEIVHSANMDKLSDRIVMKGGKVGKSRAWVGPEPRLTASILEIDELPSDLSLAKYTSGSRALAAALFLLGDGEANRVLQLYPEERDHRTRVRGRITSAMTIDEAEFPTTLQWHLESSPATIVDFETATARANAAWGRDVHALVQRLEKSSVLLLVFPTSESADAVERPRLITMNVDDLLAGMRAAEGTVHSVRSEDLPWGRGDG